MFVLCTAWHFVYLAFTMSKDTSGNGCRWPCLLRWILGNSCVCIPLLCFSGLTLSPGSHLKRDWACFGLLQRFSHVFSLKTQIKTASVEGAHMVSGWLSLVVPQRRLWSLHTHFLFCVPTQYEVIQASQPSCWEVVSPHGPHSLCQIERNKKHLVLGCVPPGNTLPSGRNWVNSNTILGNTLSPLQPQCFERLFLRQSGLVRTFNTKIC